ncbi:MAG: hypothetical protein F2772_00130 [Actinobacteria bacterium]|uniref:Unannotated protein n=1 Tax=freshwater metagenome TaxID=449393 RepID=A0A6J7BL56_9ZZZZ|nr:hypothetical protein [Actinomycetota bacterium]
MKLKIIAGLVASLAALSIAAPASAVPSTVPTQCNVPTPLLTGPSRAAHSPQPATVSTPPLCIDVTGICVTVRYPAGPSRAAHGPREAHRVAGQPCVPLAPECAFTVDVAPYIPPTTSTTSTTGPPPGPARAAHRPMAIPYSTVDIPLACQQAITASLGLPPTGGTTTPTALIATLCVLAGGALIVGTRRLALR